MSSIGFVLGQMISLTIPLSDAIMEKIFEIRAKSMKKILKKILSLCLVLGMLISLATPVQAYQMGEPFHWDLSARIRNSARREYVEMMLDHYIRTDTMVQQALDGGFAAVFLFDGASDHMDDHSRSDLMFFRVTGVCIVVKKNAAGELKITYFNDDCSTIPDRPLKYGAWSFPEFGDVGPATIFDGTYQLYSVHHKGNYEALHVRTDYWDMSMDAVYMTSEGYVTKRATEINVHTRTTDHISSVGMWSAGCPLVGDGDTWEFERLIDATYDSIYDGPFEIDNFVGTLTIDRQLLVEKLIPLYESQSAVERFTEFSREQQPEMYFKQCSEEEMLEETERRIAVREAEIMSLPCSGDTDARTKVLGTIGEGQEVTVLGSIRNSADNKWYLTESEGVRGYVYSGHLKREKFSILDFLWG